MALTERIDALNGSLTPAEQTVLTTLVAAAGNAAFLSASEVAARCSVHETTVIRLAKKLGYDGYRQLRADLRVSTSATDELLSSRASSRESGKRQFADYLRDEAEALMRLSEMVDQEQLDTVTELLTGARRVYVLGVSLLVECLSSRLRRVGVDARPVLGTYRQMAERLVGVNEGDVVFVFAVRPAENVANNIMPFLQKRNVSTVVVSDTAGATFPVAPGQLLTVIRGADAIFRTLVVPTALCYALELSVYSLKNEQAQSALTELDEIASLLADRKPRRP